MNYLVTRIMFSAVILFVGTAMAAEFDDAVKEGYQFLSAKQYEKAAAAFRRGYALANGDAFKLAGILFAEGVALFRAEKTALAEEVLQKSLTLRPDDPQTLYYLGYCRFKQNDLETALLLMKKSFERSKKSVDRFMAIKTICSFYAFYNRQADAISELEVVDSDAFTAQERLDARSMQLEYLGLMKDIPHPDNEMRRPRVRMRDYGSKSIRVTELPGRLCSHVQ
ncbi:MAG: tetratricopeptide repeat protein [Spirochaetota bacterium]